MNILIHSIGSRGDIQPYLALAEPASAGQLDTAFIDDPRAQSAGVQLGRAQMISRVKPSAFQQCLDGQIPI